jgi:Na+/melibiose symporter-like transporter
VVGLPAWLALARRRGRVLPWLLGMGLAIVSFAWAAWLGAGDVAPFAVICIVSGLGLGAELAMPPALLADQLAAHSPPLPAGAGFGWWNLVAKLNLALGAALALGLLDWAGYVPGRINVDTQRTLALIYALLPALLKCLALAVLVRARAALEAP